MITMVRPLASFLTVMRFSKEATSCACRLNAMKENKITNASVRGKGIFIVCPNQKSVQIKGLSKSKVCPNQKSVQIKGLSESKVCPSQSASESRVMAEADVFQILTGGRERSEPPGVRRL